MIYMVTTVTTTKTSLMNPFFVNSIDIIIRSESNSRESGRQLYIYSYVPFLCLAAEIIT
jgi:hypothetical protein